VEEPVKETLPVEERSPEKEDEVSSDRNNMNLPQDVGLWPSVITDMFVTECIDTEPDYFRNIDLYKTLSEKNATSFWYFV
jgi:hypothetical protein